MKRAVLTESRAPGGRRAVFWVAALLPALGFAVYGNALGNGFVIDDKLVILGDPRVQECRIGELICGRYWPEPRGDLLYRPLVMVSFAVNRLLSPEPWAFRLPNLLLHVGVGLLLFLLARDWVGSTWAALVAAIVFVVHPVHTAPLNAVVDRDELGAALFGLLAVWLYWRDSAAFEDRRWSRPALAAFCLGAAVLFKETALTLVSVIVLLDLGHWKSGGRTRPAGWLRRRIRRCYAPLLIVLAAYFGARSAALGAVARKPADISVVDNIIAHPEYDLRTGDSRFLARWGTPLAVFGKAATLVVWPRPLCWDYSYASIETVKRVRDPRLIVGAGWLLLVIATMIVSYRRRRLVFIALGIVLLTYSIVSNTFVVIGSIFAERFLYLPSVGFCLLVGVFSQAAIDRLRERAGTGQRLAAGLFLSVLVVGSAGYAWLTIDRNRDWRSDRTLNSADLRTNPRSSRLWCSAAIDAFNAKDMKTAVDNAERALAICPEYGTAWRIAGLAHWQLDSPDRALACLNRFFQMGGLQHEQAVVAAADILKSRGDYRGAIVLLKNAVKTSATAAVVRNNLAWYLITAEPVGLRDAQAALPYVRSAIELAPGQGDFVDTYVSVLLALNRRQEAIRELQRLLPTLAGTDPYRGPLARKLAELQR